ncbi:MAG: hypothetical protein PUK66_06155 [Bacteroidales bacterium]|uniref:hypothetical protein n=1 Tax=Porphyromonas sp. TaxID=1924944 RepID=UPI0029794F6F|nr:hypothetical protein [Porphyromonas sp.]MDD7438395.1 hypothetical protein [Bacteroidales bacterium]MDY3066331.1 hypothetical protein [Porphyromonas sp.]
MLLCILLASILWLIQAMDATYTKKVRIEVEPPTLPLKFAIDSQSGIPTSIEIAITARGDELFSYSLEELFTKDQALKLAVDTMLLTPDGGYISIGKEELLRQIRNTNELFDSYFDSGSDAQIRLFPDFASFSYAPLIERKVGVFFGGQIDLGEESNRMLVELEMKPEVVTVYGLATSIDSLIQAQGLISTDTNRLIVKGDSVSYHRVALIQPSGIRLTPDSVSIKTVVAPLRYNTFVISDIKIRNLPDGYNIRLFPSAIKVTFLAVKGISIAEIANQLHPYVDIDELTEGTRKLKVHLPNIPEEVQMLQLEPDAVEYLIEQQ